MIFFNPLKIESPYTPAKAGRKTHSPLCRCNKIHQNLAYAAPDTVPTCAFAQRLEVRTVSIPFVTYAAPNTKTEQLFQVALSLFQSWLDAWRMEHDALTDDEITTIRENLYLFENLAELPRAEGDEAFIFDDITAQDNPKQLILDRALNYHMICYESIVPEDSRMNDFLEFIRLSKMRLDSDFGQIETKTIESYQKYIERVIESDGYDCDEEQLANADNWLKLITELVEEYRELDAQGTIARHLEEQSARYLKTDYDRDVIAEVQENYSSEFAVLSEEHLTMYLKTTTDCKPFFMLSPDEKLYFKHLVERGQVRILGLNPEEFPDLEFSFRTNCGKLTTNIFAGCDDRCEHSPPHYGRKDIPAIVRASYGFLDMKVPREFTGNLEEFSQAESKAHCTLCVGLVIKTDSILVIHKTLSFACIPEDCSCAYKQLSRYLINSYTSLAIPRNSRGRYLVHLIQQRLQKNSLHLVLLDFASSLDQREYYVSHKHGTYYWFGISEHNSTPRLLSRFLDEKTPDDILDSELEFDSEVRILSTKPMTRIHYPCRAERILTTRDLRYPGGIN